MKKITFLLVLIGLLCVSVFAQSNQKTRPRIVQNPSPPTVKNDSSTSKKRPPVLRSSTDSDDDLGEPPPLPTPPPPVVEDDEIVTIETNLVTMPVTVFDRNGRFISGLQERDFQIFEDNIQQQIGYFAKVETPFTVILMLDVSPSTAYRIDEIQNAAIAFVNQLRINDKVGVIAFDEKVRVLARPTNDRNVLRNAIRRAQFGDGTSLYDAVDQVISRELRYIQGRKAVVLFTDGVDTTSRRASYQSSVRQIEEADALFYPIRYDTYTGRGGGGTTTRRYPQPQRRRSGGILGDILGSIIIGGNPTGYPGGGNAPAGSTRSEYEEGKRYLEELAQNSGGRSFDTNTTYNLDSAFAGIAEELRQQYQIGYYPTNVGKRGDRKRIRVRVMRPDLVVRAKNSYIVGQNNGG